MNTVIVQYSPRHSFPLHAQSIFLSMPQNQTVHLYREIAALEFQAKCCYLSFLGDGEPTFSVRNSGMRFLKLFSSKFLVECVLIFGVFAI